MSSHSFHSLWSALTLTPSISPWVVTVFCLQIQRYEGASTIFGPHTLSAYVQKFRGLARAIAEVSLVRLGPLGPSLPVRLADCSTVAWDTGFDETQCNTIESTVCLNLVLN